MRRFVQVAPNGNETMFIAAHAKRVVGPKVWDLDKSQQLLWELIDHCTKPEVRTLLRRSRDRERDSTEYGVLTRAVHLFRQVARSRRHGLVGQPYRASLPFCLALAPSRIVADPRGACREKQSMHRATPFSDQMEKRDMRRTTVFDDGPYAMGAFPPMLDLPAA